MPTSDELTAAFERGHGADLASLGTRDRELYLIQKFIIDYEIGGLSGYFYNTLPQLEELDETITAMQAQGLSNLASILAEARSLFVGFTDIKQSSTWGEVLAVHDRNDRLSDLDNAIQSIPNYGLQD